MAKSGDPNQETMRVDRFLWFARLAKTRSDAQAMAEAGTLRIDGRRIERSATVVRIGTVIAFPQRGRVRAVRINTLPLRRGPASEAATLYVDLLPNNAAAKAPDLAHSCATNIENVSQKAGVD